jgi:hypothetical protein
MKQLNATRALVKKYSEKAVLLSIKSRAFEKLLVIGLQNKGKGPRWKINPAFEKIVAVQQKIVEQEKENPTPTIETVKDPVRRMNRQKKNNVLQKLRGKDGGQRKE